MKTNARQQGRGQDILAQMGQIPVIVKGKLSERRQGDRITGHKLQRWQGKRNRTRHVPIDLVETVRLGTEGYQRLLSLMEQYVEAREQEVWEGNSNSGSKKKPTKR